MAKYTTESFIAKANEIHNNKFTYEKTIYTKMCETIIVTCPIHENFEIKASLHIHNSGCSSCGNEARREKNIKNCKARAYTTEEFIEIAKDIHGDRYDYSETEYKGLRHNVIIKCDVHGVFEQMAQAHIYMDQGCSICFKEKRLRIFDQDWNDPNYDPDYFFVKAREMYGQRYDYNKTDLVNRTNGTVEIGCRQHGSFFIRPANHIHANKKQGCQQCERVQRRRRLVKMHKQSMVTMDEFIKRAQAVHGNLYSYDNVVYKGITERVEIICQTHGSFWQTPREHWDQSGCQKCANFATSQAEKKWLEDLNVPEIQKSIRIEGKLYKFDGYNPTTNTVYEFFGDFWHGNPDVYPPEDINPRNKRPFGELYQESLDRVALFEKHGYTVIVKWETEAPTDENRIS